MPRVINVLNICINDGSPTSELKIQTIPTEKYLFYSNLLIIINIK